MATKKLRSIKGRVARITRLDSCGAPVFGECSTIVTKGFITVTIAEEKEAGDEYKQKNAWGELWINDKDPDLTKWGEHHHPVLRGGPGRARHHRWRDPRRGRGG